LYLRGDEIAVAVDALAQAASVGTSGCQHDYAGTFEVIARLNLVWVTLWTVGLAYYGQFERVYHGYYLVGGSTHLNGTRQPYRTFVGVLFGKGFERTEDVRVAPTDVGIGARQPFVYLCEAVQNVR